MGNEAKWSVLIKTNGQITKKPFNEDGDTLNQLQEDVEGYIELLRGSAQKIFPDYDIYVNEEGMILELPVNLMATILHGMNQFIHGNAVVIGRKTNELGEILSAGLTLEEADEIIEKLEAIKKDFIDFCSNRGCIIPEELGFRAENNAEV
jgi:hypothetical protein